MAVLRVRVTTAKMPHTSEFFALVKSVEHFYYALLLSTCSPYSGRTEPWRSWVEQGFSAAIRQPPPETDEMDELATSVRSDGKIIEVTASSSRDDVLDAVAHLLAAVDTHRLATTGGEQDHPPSKDIQDQLFVPVSEALRSSGVESRAFGAIMDMLSAGVRALTYRDVTSIELPAAMGAR